MRLTSTTPYSIAAVTTNNISLAGAGTTSNAYAVTAQSKQSSKVDKKRQENEMTGRIYQQMHDVHSKYNAQLSIHKSKAVQEFINNSPEQVKKIFEWLNKRNPMLNRNLIEDINPEMQATLGKQELPTYQALKSVVEGEFYHIRMAGYKTIEEAEAKLKEVLVSMYNM